MSSIHPLYVDRYVLYAHVGLALLLGAALERLPCLVAAPRAVAGGLAVPAVAALLPYSVQLRTPRSRLDDPPAAARAVGELTRPGDGCSSCPPAAEC